MVRIERGASGGAAWDPVDALVYKDTAAALHLHPLVRILLGVGRILVVEEAPFSYGALVTPRILD